MRMGVNGRWKDIERSEEKKKDLERIFKSRRGFYNKTGVHVVFFLDSLLLWTKIHSAWRGRFLLHIRY